MIKEVGIKLSAKLDNAAAQKALDKQGKSLKEQDKAINRLTKTHVEHVKKVETGWKMAERSARVAGDSMKSALHGVNAAVEKTGHGLAGLKDKFFNLKTALTTGAIGFLGYESLKKIFEAGKADLAIKGRFNRQFGGDAAGFMRTTGGLRTGMSAADNLKAMRSIGEAVSDVQEGSMLGGRKLNARQAASIRGQTFGVGAKIFQTLARLNPEMDPAEIGRMIAIGGTGPEGVRSFASAFDLNTAMAKRLNAANQRGTISKLLNTDERHKFLAKGEKTVRPGAMLELLLARSGADAEAEHKVKTLGFQIKEIGSTMEDAFGQIGATALEKMTGQLGKGKTLSERFTAALSSPEGQKAIQKIGDVIADIVGGVTKLATKLPEIFETIKAHSGLLKGVGIGIGALAAVKVGGGLLGKLIPGGSSLGGGLGNILTNKVLGDAAAIPVRVVNMGALGGGGGGLPGVAGKLGGLATAAKWGGGVLAAAGAGYAVGTLIDKWTDASGRFSGTHGDAIKRGAEARETTTADKIERERSVARSLQGLVGRGKMTPEAAQAQFTAFAMQTEGIKDKGRLGDFARRTNFAPNITVQIPGMMTPQHAAEVFEQHAPALVRSVVTQIRREAGAVGR